MKQTHKRSCLLDSFAFVLDRDSLLLMERIGHDGAENGFHSQELIQVAYDFGYAVTMIERAPVSLNPVTGKLTEIHIGTLGAGRHFADSMWWKIGVLMGRNKLGRPHAVAWKLNRLWDPADGSCFSHLEADIGLGGPVEATRFVATNFLRIDEIL